MSITSFKLTIISQVFYRVVSIFDVRMKSLKIIELLSKIIYKPPCSPSADLCCSMLCLVSGCNLVASKASFNLFVLYLNSGVSQVRKDS